MSQSLCRRMTIPDTRLGLPADPCGIDNRPRPRRNSPHKIRTNLDLYVELRPRVRRFPRQNPHMGPVVQARTGKHLKADPAQQGSQRACREEVQMPRRGEVLPSPPRQPGLDMRQTRGNGQKAPSGGKNPQRLGERPGRIVHVFKHALMHIQPRRPSEFHRAARAVYALGLKRRVILDRQQQVAGPEAYLQQSDRTAATGPATYGPGQ